jgi:phosphoribosylformylglycinamidine (FGAM) synthase PurS component
MEFAVADIVESAVSNQVNSLVGTNDTNLNTIVKMTLLQPSEEKMKAVVSQMLANNKIEKYWIDKEYGLTYDLAGNLIPVDSIHEAEKEGNLGSIVSEPERSESKAE